MEPAEPLDTIARVTEAAIAAHAAARSAPDFRAATARAARLVEPCSVDVFHTSARIC